MATPYPAGPDSADQPSAASLFSRLISDTSALFRNEIALAKTELHDAAANAKVGLTALAIATVVLLAGALALITALILGLAQVMAPWAAALVVGTVLGIIGVAMFATAKQRLAATRMPRTQTSLQHDAAMIARRT